MVKSDPKLTALNRAWLRKTEATVLPGLRRRMEYCVSDDASDFGSEVSEYAKEASKLGGKTGTYWSRPTELFARAFECYVFDTLTARGARSDRSEEHTSELQSLMRISYDVFCLKKKKKQLQYS